MSSNSLGEGERDGQLQLGAIPEKNPPGDVGISRWGRHIEEIPSKCNCQGLVETNIEFPVGSSRGLGFSS